MNRFFCDSHDVREDKIFILDKEQVHHIKDVLRFAKGKKAVIVDERSNEYAVEAEFITDREAVFIIIGKKAASGLKKPRVTIACAIPKKSKIDDTIDKLTQLGVDRIIPLMTERVIVRLDREVRTSRLARWKKIALSASQQSQRNGVPAIDDVTEFIQLVQNAQQFDLKLIPHLAGIRKTLHEVLTGSSANNILVVIGPEGDFTPQEVDLALHADFIPITFGDFVLRVETAAVYIAGILRYELHEDG